MQTPFHTVAEAIAHAGDHWPDNGYVFQNDAGEERPYSFIDIAADTARRAAALQELGLQKGDRMGVVIIEPEQFVLTFLAALRIGVIPVPLYPPLSLGNLDAYAVRTATILANAGAKVLVTSARLQNLLWSQVDKVSTLDRLVTAEELQSDAEPVFPEILPEDTAFLQYTSGSTSEPKGVIVSHGNLVANANGMMGPTTLDMSPETDIGVSWLPLYHDMGLIGFVISPILWGMPIVFIPTLRFIKRPTCWLETITRHKATITFAPNFAYALVARRARPHQLDEWDLSTVKAFGCGAEPINPETMRAFTEVMTSRCGMRREALLPAYGMAEATLAIAFKPLDEHMRTLSVDAERFEEDGIVETLEEGDERQSFEHVSCGRWFPKHEVTVQDPDGNYMAEGHEGEICLKGPSVTQGYYKNPEATAAAFKDGWLRTGDLGYVLDGEVYVTGRLKDLIILNGRNLHPQSIEWVAAQVEGVRMGNVVAFSRPGSVSEELVIVAESKVARTDADRTALAMAIKKEVLREMSVSAADIQVVAAGLLPKTSSGKLQRRKTRQQYLARGVGSEGSRTAGSSGSTMTVARHMAKGVWSRTKATLRK